MKKKLINILKKNKHTRKLLEKMVFYKRKFIYKKYCKKTTVNKNIIIFESFMGRTYSDNPRAIYEEMLNNHKYDDFEFVWCFREPEKKEHIDALSRATIIKYNSKDYYKYYSEAKYFVSNSRLPDAIVPREGQVYIQTWHGTPLKRLGYDLTNEVEGGNAKNSLEDMRNKYKVDAERYTYLLSPSKFCTEKFTSCFNLKENNPHCQIVEKGYPRNDFLSNYTKSDIKRIKENLKIDDIRDKKIILYAPTWRDNQYASSMGYTYKSDVDFDLLQKKLGKDYIILFRAHYFVANSFDFKKYSGFVYDVSNYEDINELYAISDMLITDYSSVFFDYAILKRPIIFYMYDLKEYQEEIRGFYLDLGELPGNIVENEEDLIKEINKMSKGFKCDKRYKAFNDKFNYLDDGNATKRILDVVIEHQD